MQGITIEEQTWLVNTPPPFLFDSTNFCLPNVTDSDNAPRLFFTGDE